MSRPRPEICDCLFAHEILRRLGILPAEIFLDLRCEGFYGISVKKGGKEWAVLLGRLPIHHAEFAKEWEAGTAYWNGASDEEIEALGFHQSAVVLRAGEIIRSLVAKGIELDPVGAARAMDERWKAAN